MSETDTTLSRRSMLKLGGAIAAAPAFIPASALGQDGRPAPSERIALAHIGVGGMGTSNSRSFREHADCQIVAGCDVDASHVARFKRDIDEHYGNSDCKTYHDFRELLQRDDIDAVCIATPDHWHSIPVIAAANAGKDIYCEKPISHTFGEGMAMLDAVTRNNRVWQTGSWQRSVFNFRQAAEIVRNGRIGKVSHVEVGLPYGHSGNVGWEEYRRRTRVSQPPHELDYNFWLGPAPWAEYCPARVHGTWRWNLTTGGGQIMDWIGHHNDIAHWGLDRDYSGPVKVHAVGNFPDRDAVWNSPISYLIESTYDDGTVVIIKDSSPVPRGESAERGHYMGVKWIGTEGWVYADRGVFQTYPESLKDEPADEYEVRLYHSDNHWRNFLDCVRSREKTITPIEVSHRSITPGHLGYASMFTGRTIAWDPAGQKVVGDETAQQMLFKKMRSPWSV